MHRQCQGIMWLVFGSILHAQTLAHVPGTVQYFGAIYLHVAQSHTHTHTHRAMIFSQICEEPCRCTLAGGPTRWKDLPNEFFERTASAAKWQTSTIYTYENSFSSTSPYRWVSQLACASELVCDVRSYV